MNSWEEWLAGRPEIVQRLARKYPPGTAFLIHGEILHVMSYRENGTLGVTPIDPDQDYDAAKALVRPICKCCMEKLDDCRV